MKPVKPKSVARDANAWAAKIRKDAERRGPGVPAPVTISAPKDKVLSA